MRVYKMIYGWPAIREAFGNWATDAAAYLGIIYRLVNSLGGLIPGMGSNETKLSYSALCILL